MIKDHLITRKEPRWRYFLYYSFQYLQKGIFCKHHFPFADMIVHTIPFVTRIVEHWLELALEGMLFKKKKANQIKQQ